MPSPGRDLLSAVASQHSIPQCGLASWPLPLPSLPCCQPWRFGTLSAGLPGLSPLPAVPHLPSPALCPDWQLIASEPSLSRPRGSCGGNNVVTADTLLPCRLSLCPSLTGGPSSPSGPHPACSSAVLVLVPSHISPGTWPLPADPAMSPVRLLPKPCTCPSQSLPLRRDCGQS